MLVVVQNELCKRGSHTVARATGRFDRREAEQCAATMAAQNNISYPEIQIIHLNTAERDTEAEILIIVTERDR